VEKGFVEKEGAW